MRSRVRQTDTFCLGSPLSSFHSHLSWAAKIYVSPTGTGPGTKASPTNLQNALDMARTNGQDDVIYLRQGTYSTGSGPFSYGSSGNDSKAVSLLGGWNTGFTARSSDPSLTLLDGGGATRVLEVIADVAGVSIDFSIEGLTIQNGYGSDDRWGRHQGL